MPSQVKMVEFSSIKKAAKAAAFAIFTSLMLSSSKVKASQQDGFRMSSDGTMWTEQQSSQPSMAKVSFYCIQKTRCFLLYGCYSGRN
jgi:hypothetical protein